MTMATPTPVLNGGEQLLQFVEARQRVTSPRFAKRSRSAGDGAARLEALEGEGKLRRFSRRCAGGAERAAEPSFAERSGEQAEEKRRIGRGRRRRWCATAKRSLLGSGTTVLEVARSLRQHRDLTVITNSLLVMNMLATCQRHLIGLGGILRSTEQSFIGHLTEQALGELRVNKVILGIRAIDLATGITNDYLPETQTDRKNSQHQP